MGLLVVVMIAFQGSSAPGAVAQEGDSCLQIAAQALADAQAACAANGRGEVCFGHAGVTAAGATLAASGDRAPVADLQTLATSPADPGTGDWGIALLHLSAGLPEGSAVTAILFGEAQIARPAQAAPDQPTLAVTNGRGSEINLRNGAATTYDLVGQLAPGEQATADGRNEQGDWMRGQFSGGIGWAFVPLIQWDGDQSAIDALPVRLPNDVTPPAAAGEPFQSFSLTTGAAACSAAPSGLLLQYSGEQPAQVQVNQVSLEFSDATLLITARASDRLSIRVLDGSSRVIARGVPEQAGEGEQVSVSLGGDDGLTPLEAPQGGGSYAFADVAYAPLALLPGSLVCRAGLPSDAGRVVLRVGPGTQRGELGDMSAGDVRRGRRGQRSRRRALVAVGHRHDAFLGGTGRHAHAGRLCRRRPGRAAAAGARPGSGSERRCACRRTGPRADRQFGLADGPRLGQPDRAVHRRSGHQFLRSPGRDCSDLRRHLVARHGTQRLPAGAGPAECLFLQRAEHPGHRPDHADPDL